MNEIKSVFCDSLRAQSIGSISKGDVLKAYEGWSVRRLSEFFAKHQISGAPVIASDETLVGVVTQTDIVVFESETPKQAEVEKILQHYIGPNGVIHQSEIERIKSNANDYCTVNSIMTPEVISIESERSLYDACKLIEERNVHRLFVTENSVLTGVVTAMDILKSLIEK